MVCFASSPAPPLPSVDSPHLFLVREVAPGYAPGPSGADTPLPDPFTDADSLEALEEEVVVLAAHIHAATHRLLTLIAEFDRRRGWELGGHRSCAHWLSFRTGIDLGAAREKVRAARAVEAASDVLFREEGIGVPDSDSQKRAAQRRADALGLLAERAMEVGFRDGTLSGTRAARYQVVLHVDEGTLADPQPTLSERASGVGREAAPLSGRSELEDGTRVSPAHAQRSRGIPLDALSAMGDGPLGSAETSRRISCDCGVVKVVHGQDHSILDIGRKTRSIPPALCRALEVRDRGCRFPGCGSRFTDAHHVTHWADGGETSLTNTLLLCKHHHRLVHEGGWRVDWWGEGRPVFFDPRGGMQFEGGWKPPEGRKDGSAEMLVHDNEARGITPDGWTPSARWKREWDIPDEVLWRAEEAMLGGKGVMSQEPEPGVDR